MSGDVAPLKRSSRNAGLRTLWHGMIWLLAAFVLGALGFVLVPLFPSLGYFIGFPVLALGIWGVGKLLLGLGLYLSAERSP